MGETVLDYMFPYTPPQQTAQVEPTKKTTDDVTVDIGPNQGKHFPDHVEVIVDGEKTKLRLTGVLTRKFEVQYLPISLDLYYVACYTQERPQGDAEQMLDDLIEDTGGIKAYVVCFAKQAPAGPVNAEIQKEIDTYFPKSVVANNRPAIDAFVGQLMQDKWIPPDSKVYVVRLPGGVIYSKYRSPSRLNFIGDDPEFAKAIWRIWAGVHSGDDRYGLIDRLTPTPAE